MENETLRLIARRHVKRAYLPTPVPRALVESVLTTAANAPSSRHMQPWSVSVAAGRVREALSARLLEKFDAGITEASEYPSGPDVFPENLKRRAAERRKKYFDLMGWNLADPNDARQQERRNFTFYQAPLVLFFLLPKEAGRGQFLDLGFFMQNVMLGFLSFGIDGCPQESLLKYSHTIRDHLKISPDLLIAATFSCGYADPKARENQFIATRAPLSEYFQWQE